MVNEDKIDDYKIIEESRENLETIKIIEKTLNDNFIKNVTDILKNNDKSMYKFFNRINRILYKFNETINFNKRFLHNEVSLTDQNKIKETIYITFLGNYSGSVELCYYNNGNKKSMILMPDSFSKLSRYLNSTLEIFFDKNNNIKGIKYLDSALKPFTISSIDCTFDDDGKILIEYYKEYPFNNIDFLFVGRYYGIEFNLNNPKKVKRYRRLLDSAGETDKFKNTFNKLANKIHNKFSKKKYDYIIKK